jgi:hypothetical protein
MANNINTLPTNNSFVRAYGDNGKVITNKRGQAIMEMLSYVKDGVPLIKSYKRYARKNKGAVTYARFAVFVGAFRNIINTKHGKKLIDILDTRPKVTYQGVLKNACAYAEYMETLTEVL